MLNISVLLCAYQESLEDFEIAVKSVIQQTHPPKQLIIVDDSGSLKYRTRCEQIQEALLSKIKVELTYVGNAFNSGLVASLNLGLARVTEKYVARMDADDISLPYRFHEQLKLLERGFDIVGGGISLFGNMGHIGNIIYPTTQAGVFLSLLRSNPIAHPVAMFRTDKIRKLMGYREVAYAEDLDLWMRAYLAGNRISNSRNILLLRRIHDQQLSSKFNADQKASTYKLRKIFRRQILGLSTPTAVNKHIK